MNKPLAKVASPISKSPIGAFLKQAKSASLRGHHDILTEGSKELLVITRGSIYLYLEIVDDEGELLKRQYFLTLNRGDVLWNFSGSHGPTKVHFRGSHHSSALVLNEQLIEQIAKSPECTLEFTRFAESWVSQVTMAMQTLAAKKQPSCLALKAGCKEQLDKGTKITSCDGLLWLNAEQLCFLGQAEFDEAVPEKPEFLPLTPSTFSETHCDGSVSPQTTVALVARNVILDLINDFNNFCLQATRELIEKRIKDDKSWMTKKAHRFNIDVEATSNRLTNLFTSKRQHHFHSEYPLYAHASELIRKIGHMPVFPNQLDESQPDHALQQIANESGMCLRHATLPYHWWQKDFGQCLAFSRDGSKPYILMSSRGKTWLWNLEDDSKTCLNEKNKDLISPKVVFFYPALPATKITPMQFLMFGLSGIKTEICGIIFFSLIATMVSALVPMIIAQILNSALPSGNTGLLLTFGLAIVAVGCIKGFYQWMQELTMARLEHKIELQVMTAIWDRVISFPSRVLNTFSAGDLYTRMGSLAGFQTTFRSLAQTILIHGTTMFFSTAVMIHIHKDAGLVALALSLFSILASVVFSILQIRAFMGGEKSLGLVNSYVLEIFSAIHKIRSAGAESTCFMQWAERFSRIRSKMIRSRKVINGFQAFKAFWNALSMAGIFITVVLLNKDQLNAGLFIAFIAAYAMMTASLEQITTFATMSSMQIPMYKFAAPILQNCPVAKSNKIIPPVLNGHIRIENLSFRYQNSITPALTGINLDIRQGEFIAIVGMSGSGKTSLVKNIVGLESPTSGSIYIDDYDMQSIDPAYLKKHISVVMQQSKLLPGSLYENIKGISDASLDEVWKAAELACIADDIRNLPMGMHTVVHGDDNTFSGGQIQRIAIARTLVQNPVVLLFDEATSSLDNQTQANIMKNLSRLKTTKIVVAHRLSTIQNADRIIVLEEGRVTESGDYKTLVEQKGTFAKLIQRQLV